jgi:very-short-patch-repair endonuclease
MWCMSDERALARTAASQFGLLTIQQEAAGGVSKDARAHRRSTGRYERVAPGVDAIGGAPQTWEQRVVAGCLAVGRLVGGSHRTALRVWEIGVFRHPIELSVEYSRDPVPPGFDVHRSRDLTSEDVVLRRGVPVTTVTRTLVDIGAVLPEHVVEQLVERACGRKLTTPADLRRQLAKVGRKGRRGAGVLRRILERRALGEDLTDSELEEMLARACRDHGVPIPQCQVWVPLDGRWRRLDFAYPEAKIVIEVDGYETHTSWCTFEDDRVRQNALITAGWRVLRFTRAQLVERPSLVAAAIRRLL